MDETKGFDLIQYVCKTCNYVFYADFGIIERCPNCGLATQVEEVKGN